MFFMVWSERSHETHVRHDTKDRAINEASRLAAANPGCKFYVLAALGLAEVQKPTVYRPLPFTDDNIPF